MNQDCFWPTPEAFLDLSVRNQLSDGTAACTVVAMCDDNGRPTRHFCQGQRAHVFYEFEIRAEIGVAAGGVEFRDARGWIIHGKNGFQYDTQLLMGVCAGTRLRCHSTIQLEVAPGEYWFTVGLASVAESAYRDYRQGRLGHLEFARLTHEHCRVEKVGSFTVDFAADGKLLHHGVANLPGHISVTVEHSPFPTTAATVPEPAREAGLAIFHVTHWKAGSQWIRKILADCAPELIVEPEVGSVQFLRWPLQPGKVYPAVYVTKQEFDHIRKPAASRHFVVIRDLRDTLVSAYFSLKISHPILDAGHAKLRRLLQSMSLEDGMIYLMDEWLPQCARIQTSWLESGEPLIRYRDLLGHDVEILERVLLDECGLPVARERFRNVVLSNRFEKVTCRSRGQEDATAHERKGIASDWKNHFNGRLKQAFKARYGGLLVAAGFERNLEW